MGIGKANKLPWRLKGDLEYFSKITVSAPKGKINAVIMGSNTWFSLPTKSRPLQGRINVVLNKEEIDLPRGVILATSFEEAFGNLSGIKNLGKVFIIGGASIYAQAITMPLCDKIYLTEIEDEFDCDTFFPKIPENFKLKSVSAKKKEKNISYRFAAYAKAV